jgi:hypothetical protein
MKHLLAATLLLIPGTIAAVAVPAGAAVPKTKPTYTVPCGKKAATIWANANPGNEPSAPTPWPNSMSGTRASSG